MFDGRSAMGEGVVHALAQDLNQITLDGSRNIPADHVATEGQGQVRCALPPFPQIGYAFQTGVRVGELSFVNDEASVRAALVHRIENPIEWHDDVFELAKV